MENVESPVETQLRNILKIIPQCFINQPIKKYSMQDYRKNVQKKLLSCQGHKYVKEGNKFKIIKHAQKLIKIIFCQFRLPTKINVYILWVHKF